MRKHQIQVLIYILATIWAIILAFDGIMPFTLAFYKPMTLVTAIGIILIGVFDKWLWKWNILRPWFVKMPNISGTWKASIDSNYINPETQEPQKNIEAYFIIKQTFSSIKIRLLTNESSSDLLGGELVEDKNNSRYSITGVYFNEPKQSKRSDSPMHYGALFCKIIINNNNILLEGEYWTSRNSQGEIKFQKRIKEHCSSFNECISAFTDNANISDSFYYRK